MKRKGFSKAVMKMVCLLVLICILTAGISISGFAAGWIQNGGYWWYQNEDGSYACNGYQFINGKLYQFDQNGCWVKSGNEQNEGVDEALYRAFLSQQFAGKGDVRIALVDLTNDGHEEMIVTCYEDGFSYSGMYIHIYTIAQNQVKEILKQYSQNFRYELYLCVRNGKACLLEKVNSVYQGEGDLSYLLYDFKSDGTQNILDSYWVHVILNTAQGDRDESQFKEKANALATGAVLITQGDDTKLWPANNVLKDNEAVYEGSCASGPLIKENGIYHYSGIIEGYDESRADKYGHWTEGYYELARGDFYVDNSTKVVIKSDLDYGFPVNGKSAEAWLDDFYARKEYWMVLNIKVKGNHIEEIQGIYSFD